MKQKLKTTFMKMTCRTLRKKWLWPDFPPMETAKKLPEAQAPRAAGHPAQSTSQTCPSGFGAVGGGAGAGPLLQGPTAPGKSCLAELIRVFCSCRQPLGSVPKSHSLLCPAAPGQLELLLDTGLLRSPLGMYPISWAK